VIAEALDGLERHRINSLRTDQLLGIQHIPVGRVFRAGAGPQGALRARSLLLENSKRWLAEESSAFSVLAPM
jgi:hypothetical protein